MNALVDPASHVKNRGVALTGGIASGKSLVSTILRGLGFQVFDADQFARQVVAPGHPGLERIRSEFGGACFDGQRLDRSKLRSLIAKDESVRLRLGQILHPLIRQAYLLKVSDELLRGDFYHFYEAALIFENNLENDYHQVWLCDCSRETQIGRLMKRDDCKRVDAEKLVDMQLSREQRLAKAGTVIDTECSPDLIKKRVLGLLATLKEDR